MASCAEFLSAVQRKPYAEHGEGPEAFDCWGLTRACQRAVFGRELPIVGADRGRLLALLRGIEEAKEDLATQWPEIASAKPAHGDILLMSHSQRGHHVGTWLDIDGGGVLHALETFGVCFDSLAHLRVMGFRKITVHRFHAGPA